MYPQVSANELRPARLQVPHPLTLIPDQVQADGTLALIVHIFNPEVATWRRYHGKVITAHARFRGRESNYPNSDLLLFHYSQCSMKHLRGWSSA